MKHTSAKTALNATGQTYKNYLITKYIPLEELQSTLIELIHEPSGARIMHIANDDPENLFCLSLQTLPSSSNGVAHILEHTVLCGSKKFPIKDPFFAMMRRSLNTFMNALTGQDFTCYPASSQVEKDFYNLLEVYLDAVFHPLLKKTSFLQEGHRLEFSEPMNPDAPLQIQGVVYNEMKGAMSSADARLWEAVSKHLIPDLPYAFNSGGNPKDIPSLSYEELIDFHQTFYHPSRCLFFLYGNIELSKHLDFIERHALQHTPKLPPIPPLPLQNRFKSPIRAIDYYPIHEGEELKAKAKIAFCWLTVPLTHQSEVLALCLIECLLMETDASYLKKALLKSGFCKEADSSLDIEMSEVPFSIVCSGCNLEDEKKLHTLLFSTLEEICQKPIDPDMIEASLHQLQFQRTEIGGEGGPFGLTLFMRAALIKQHGNEAEQSLLIHQLFAELRDRLKDLTYLPGLIRTILIENPHFLTQILLPDPHLEQKELAAEAESLKRLSASMSQEEKQTLILQAQELATYQKASEKQSIDCLPKVTLNDIPLKARDFPLIHTSLKHLEVYRHECFTNQIVYADFLFDLPHIEVDELPLLSLLSHLWTELGCAGKSYEEALHTMQAHTGGIDAHLALHVSSIDSNVLKPAFSLRGKALFPKAQEFFHLLNDYASAPDFTDQARIREWLIQHLSELEDDLPRNAIQYAIQLSLSGYSSASFIYNQWNGLPYYLFVKQLAEDRDTKWIERLSIIAKQLLSTGKPHLILSCGTLEAEHLLAKEFYNLGSWTSSSKAPSWQGKYPISSIASQAKAISSPVAFTALGMRTCAYCEPGVAELMISTQLLETVVLHKEIREKGGAYGGAASYSPTTGNYHLYAYRDPQLSKTIDIFQQAIEKIGSGKFNDRELEEAKISLIASMDTPVVPGGRAIVAYAWLRSQRTLQDRQRLREQILAATKEEVANTVRRCLQFAPSTLVSFLGPDLYIKEAKKLKTPLPLKDLKSEELLKIRS